MKAGRHLNGRILRTAGLVLCVVVAPAAEAGQGAAPQAPAARSEPAEAANLPFAFEGPPPPLPPAVIARDGSGRVTVRAVRLTSPLQIDGRLDEAIYTTVPPMSDFIQVEPAGGEPATEQTEVWVTFDGDHVYVALRCRDSHPERMVANEMRRDNNNMFRTSMSASSSIRFTTGKTRFTLPPRRLAVGGTARSPTKSSTTAT